MAFRPAKIEQIGHDFRLGEFKIVVYRDKYRVPKRYRHRRGRMRHYLVSGPTVIGGMFDLVYLLPSRSPHLVDSERFRRLPRDLLRTFGPPIPAVAFAGGRLRPLKAGIRVWRIRVPGRDDHIWKEARHKA
jgi:hypothetical protein